ncbi:hypothetical protein [Microbulbifer hainanensis]|uniref:hypothetical protein n=1 Tax=Microbulbifer hainanensis TaxID=2735675 RepID=UPI0018695AF7|nr:hypothetical protein [Microbulbifer hainanensis]
MVFRRAAVCALLSAVGLFSSVAAVAEAVSASASARITLHVSARLQLKSPVPGAPQQLCISQVPAQNYYLLLAEDSQALATAGHVVGRQGSYCLKSAVTAQTGYVMVVAQ